MQAVAGIVGCAELLCAALSIPALLCFFMAVDGRYAAAQQLQAVRQSAVKVNTPAPTVPSNLQAAAAPVQHQSAAEPTDEQQDPGLLDAADTLQHWLLVLAAVVLAVCAALSKEIGITVIGTMVLYDALWAPHMRVPVSDPASARAQQTFTAACRRQVLRMLLVAATAAAYIKLRQWVAVQQLVNIYRKVRPSFMSC